MKKTQSMLSVGAEVIPENATVVPGLLVSLDYMATIPPCLGLYAKANGKVIECLMTMNSARGLATRMLEAVLVDSKIRQMVECKLTKEAEKPEKRSRKPKVAKKTKHKASARKK